MVDGCARENPCSVSEEERNRAPVVGTIWSGSCIETQHDGSLPSVGSKSRHEPCAIREFGRFRDDRRGLLQQPSGEREEPLRLVRSRRETWKQTPAPGGHGAASE